MNHITFKTIDGIVYTGEIIYFGKEEISVKNLIIENGEEEDVVPNLKDRSCKYNGEVWFYKNKMIWYTQKN